MSRRVSLVVAAATALMVVQACGPSRPSGLPSRPLAGAHSTETHSNVDGPARQIDVNLVLRTTTVRAGGEIRGTLILVNHGPRPLKSTCGFSFVVGIANAAITFRPMFLEVCIPGTSVPLGVSRYPVTLNTTYEGCYPSGKPDGARPPCLSRPAAAGGSVALMPPLPAGIYHTEVASNGLPGQDVRLPAPITVTLTT